MTVDIYAAKSGPPASLDGWSKIASDQQITGKDAKIDLDTAGQAFRYYLVWIKKLPSDGQAKVTELYLFR
jgi:hypothetical protein